MMTINARDQTQPIATPALSVVALIAAAIAPAACTDVELRKVEPVVAIAGQYCTEPEIDFSIPIRVLTIVDTSGSMKTNDPALSGDPVSGPGYRSKASNQLVAELSNTGADIKFGFISFGSGANDVTNGFTDDIPALEAAIPALDNRVGFTNYLDALGHAEDMIREDARKVREEMIAAEEAGESVRFLKPWYFVLFFSDGYPIMEYETQTEDAILAKLESIMKYPPEEALGITFHTAYLGAPDQDMLVRQQAEDLLRKMATVGKGTFTSFSSGDEIDFSMFDFKIKRLYEVQDLIAFNRNTIFGVDTILADSDADGLADRDEIDIGTDPLSIDSDSDGMGDGFEVLSALDPLTPDHLCDADAEEDTDGDGLNDCEEKFRNFDFEMFDTDSDDVSDGLEFYSGTNPGNSADLRRDMDFDGVTAGQEIRMRTSPAVDDREIHEAYGYRYSYAETPTSYGEFQKTGSNCFRFTIENVSLVDTMAVDGKEAGDNEFVIQLGQSPADDAQSIFALYELRFIINYNDIDRVDPDVRLDVSSSAFELISTQDVSKN